MPARSRAHGWQPRGNLRQPHVEVRVGALTGRLRVVAAWRPLRAVCEGPLGGLSRSGLQPPPQELAEKRAREKDRGRGRTGGEATRFGGWRKPGLAKTTDSRVFVEPG